MLIYVMLMYFCVLALNRKKMKDDFDEKKSNNQIFIDSNFSFVNENFIDDIQNIFKSFDFKSTEKMSKEENRRLQAMKPVHQILRA